MARDALSSITHGDYHYKGGIGPMLLGTGTGVGAGIGLGMARVYWSGKPISKWFPWLVAGIGKASAILCAVMTHGRAGYAVASLNAVGQSAADILGYDGGLKLGMKLTKKTPSEILGIDGGSARRALAASTATGLDAEAAAATINAYR